ncbi:hypothetical protein [Solibacillus isronensis]|uniref:hypothetical protein n=1 Tax=Solibacillus isronensis TaxID=412383 RepID=UPI00203BEAC8|nr:hypothetical protein [Solibacillus isronensis]MCM3721698.1 hypothetical protein [Solibacillus isronensis]
MGFKEEFRREMRNAQNDIANEVEKQWVLEFEGHQIEVMNGMMEEVLKVDGQIIAQNVRKSIWSHIIPFSTMKGTFQSKSGKTHKVDVKIGGFVKLNITVKVDGKQLLHEAMKLQFLPWANKEFIVPFLEEQFKQNQQLITKDLPDDGFLYDEHHPKLAPGFADQLHQEAVTPFYTKKLIKLFLEQVINPSDRTRKSTYEKIKDEKVISYFHEFLELFSEADKDEDRVKNEAIWLLEHAAHREVVKFALLVLGTVKCEEYKERLKVIALHEEFTGVALFTLTNGTTNSNETVWHIAQNVSDWGKLEALNFLDASNEEIRQWILQEGLNNTVPGNASALMCAEKGKLDIELHEKIISGKIFDSAGSIILALLYEGAYQTLDEYEYSGQVLMRYTHHAKTHCLTFNQFFVLTQINEYLQYDEETWEDRFSSNWKPHEKRTVEENIEEIAQNPLWLQEALEILQNDQVNEEKALAVAKFYKADITDIVFEKLKNNPENVQYYYSLFASKDSQIIEQLIEITNTFGNFNELTNEQKVVVLSLIEELDQYNGVGMDFIGQALKTTDDHLQYMAIQTLHSFERSHWQGTEIELLVVRYAKESKDPDVKEIAKQLLATNE